MDSDQRSPGILALHASAVETQKGALLFLGHAGSGKSTICRLLNTRFPCLADDAVWLIQQQDRAWYVAHGDNRVFAGPPTPGEFTGFETVPLRAVLRLRQDTVASLNPVAPSEVCRHLTDALFEIAWQRHREGYIIRRLFNSVAQIAREYDGWLLHFIKDQTTSDLISHQFDG